MRYLLFTVLLPVSLFSQEPFHFKKQVSSFAREHYPGVSVAYIAEAQLENTGIAMFWPCLIQGDFISDDIIALILARQDSLWIPVDHYMVSEDSTLSTFHNYLQKYEYVWNKPAYTGEVKYLDDDLETYHQKMQLVLAEKESDPAVDYIEKIFSMFDIQYAIFTDFIPLLIIRGLTAFNIEDMEYLTQNEALARLIWKSPGNTETHRIKLKKYDEGWVIHLMEKQ